MRNFLSALLIVVLALFAQPASTQELASLDTAEADEGAVSIAKARTEQFEEGLSAVRTDT